MPSPMSNAARIMLVDDDPGLRTALEFLLGIEGFEVESFESGEALTRKQNFPAAGCLVLDWRLPRMNGLETLRKLRLRDINLPAILITSNPSRDLLAQAATAGVRVVEKPLLSNELTDHIRYLLGTG